ncbi:MAG: hypothetical protein OEV94_08530 [Deltaproteobacteria bacterium]|nr:hypothetical protein [Deltaproteobacteria bacterium]
MEEIHRWEYLYQHDPLPTQRRRLNLPPGEIRHGNVEAWMNILRSYHHAHPAHGIVFYFRDEPVNSPAQLFRQTPILATQEFRVEVEAADEDWSDLPKLTRLLAEGAGENFEMYLSRELYQIKDLF